MSSGATSVPELVFKIAKAAVYTELTPPPSEVASAPEGLVTESFGPTQVVLHKAHVKGHLDPQTPYEIKASTPHNFDIKNMHYIGPLPDGSLLFRKLATKV